MPETHVPKLEEDDKTDKEAANTSSQAWRKSVTKIALEITLISVGVFLGLAGEQWREDRRHRELAESSLRSFRSEIVINRKTTDPEIRPT
jgi:hypothetical protein